MSGSTHHKPQASGAREMRRENSMSLRDVMRLIGVTVATLASAAAMTLVVTATPAFASGGGPTVTAVSPTSGPVSGGTSITITGTNFTGATAVSIDGVAAA